MKYRNKTKEVDGIRFDSQVESQFYEELKLLKRAGKIKDFELQPKFTLLKPYRKCPKCNHIQDHIPGSRKKANLFCQLCGEKLKYWDGVDYYADFKIINNDGSERICDVKGTTKYMDDTFKLKRRFFECYFPDKTIEIVIMKPERKGAKA